MLSESEVDIFRQLRLLSAKPLLLVCNVSESGLSENPHVEKLKQHLNQTGFQGVEPLTGTAPPVTTSLLISCMDRCLGGLEAFAVLNNNWRYSVLNTRGGAFYHG